MVIQCQTYSYRPLRLLERKPAAATSCELLFQISIKGSSHSSQCSTTGVTMTVVYTILSVGDGAYKASLAVDMKE